MISLRKHIDKADDDLFEASAACCRSVLALLGGHLTKAVPGISGDLKGNLRSLADELEAEPALARVQKMPTKLDSELTAWGESVERHLKSKAAEAREIMLAMASAAQSMTSRDMRYSTRFRDITARMESIADLEDLSEMRRSLVLSAQQLNKDIRDMQLEGRQVISELEIQLHEYRKQLAEAEQRQCLDVLTGLINRRGLETELDRRCEAGSRFCVVMLDLDGFKPVNDTHGHAAGDDLLRQFAVELRAHFQSHDVVGRWGGDEFMVVVRGDEQGARTCVERLRKWAFGTYTVRLPRGVCAVPVSASIGIAVWDLKEERMQLVQRADESMYLDKKIPRNGRLRAS